MKVLELIPNNILTKIMIGKELSFNKIEKNFYSIKFDIDIMILFNKFTSIKTEDYETELEMLKNLPILQVTNEDLECVNYNLKPLKYEQVKEALSQFDCVDILPLFLVVKTVYYKYREKLSNKKRAKIIENLRLFQRLDRKFQDICYGKGLTEYYEKVNQEKNNIDYLIKYINALE